jgi:phage/plasmid-like protein (TIGR03299 family)
MTNIRQEAWGSFGTEAQGTTAKEVCENAGLSWDAVIEPLYDKRGEVLTARQRGVFRDDTNECLGVVGKSYHVKQHQDVAELAHRLTGVGELEWAKIGVVGNGEKAWFNLALPDEILINGNEPIQGYMTLMNSHDGSSGIRVIPNTIRMACGNQMNMVLRDAKSKNGIFTIRHTSKMDEMIDQMIEAINMTNVMLDEWAKDAQNMMEVEMDIGDRVQFYLDHLPIKQNEEMMKGGEKYDVSNPYGLATRGKNILDRVIALEGEAQNNVGDMNGTLWQTVNVVSDYIDHDWITTKNGQVNARRAESAMVGTGQRIKTKAWEAALARMVA